MISRCMDMHLKWFASTKSCARKVITYEVLDDKNLFPASDDLFLEMRSWLCTGGNKEIIPEALVVSSTDTAVKFPPVVDKQ